MTAETVSDAKARARSGLRRPARLARRDFAWPSTLTGITTVQVKSADSVMRLSSGGTIPAGSDRGASRGTPPDPPGSDRGASPGAPPDPRTSRARTRKGLPDEHDELDGHHDQGRQALLALMAGGHGHGAPSPPADTDQEQVGRAG